jgi:RNA polymerase sigma-70 factor, ECF subfamily
MNSKNTLETIFHEYYSPLCNYATKITGNDLLAEDLVQDLFIQLWQSDKLDHIQNTERYLLRCVKFKCIDHFRKQKAQELSLSDLPSEAFETTDIAEEDIEPMLHYFAAKLPPKTRQVFLLSRQTGMTYRQIAEHMNISEKTVEHQMGRALNQLRIILKTSGFYTLIFFI